MCPQSSAEGSVLFNTFSNALEEGTERTLSQFVHGTKLGESVDLLGG